MQLADGLALCWCMLAHFQLDRQAAQQSIDPFILVLLLLTISSLFTPSSGLLLWLQVATKYCVFTPLEMSTINAAAVKRAVDTSRK